MCMVKGTFYCLLGTVEALAINMCINWMPLKLTQLHYSTAQRYINKHRHTYWQQFSKTITSWSSLLKRTFLIFLPQKTPQTSDHNHNSLPW